MVPYIFGGALYDENIFRVADEEEARVVSGDTRMSDTVYSYGMGFRINKPISLQILRLDAAIEQVNYQNFDNLDHTGGNALLAWDWEIGRVLDGTLSHSYARRLSDFSEFQQATRDIREINRSHFSGGVNLLSAWRLELGGESRQVRYDVQTFLDRDEEMGFAQLMYATSVNTRVGFRMQHTVADLEPQPATGMAANNDYHENEYSLVVGWEGGANSYLEARAGYTRRDQEEAIQDDLSGATGKLTHQWQMTPIFRLRTSIFRNTNALDYQISTFVVTDGALLEPSWQVLVFLGVPDDGRQAFPVHNAAKERRYPGVNHIVRLAAAGKRRLGIHRGFGVLDLIDRGNTRQRRRPPVPESVRKELVMHFEPEIARLSSVLGRDLTHWTRIGRSDDIG